MNLRHGRARVMSSLGVLFALIVLTSCGHGGGTGPDTSSSVPARVVVTPGADTLTWITATRQMSASVLNSTGLALNMTVTWSSSASSVATVSSSGMVTAVGVGRVNIVAKAGSISGSAALVIRQDPATVEKISGDAQSGNADETLDSALVVEVRDEGDVIVPAAPLRWSVASGGGRLEMSMSTADESGRGRATWRLGSAAGAQSVRVSSGDAPSVEFGATAKLVPTGAVTVTGVSPSVLIEGEAATITGTGFGSNVTVLLDGDTVQVTGVTATSLAVTVPHADCLPPRHGSLFVSVGGDSVSVQVPVSPAATSDLAMSVGYYRHTGAGDACLYLPGATSGAEYMIGALSTSETPSSLVDLSLTSVAGDASVQGASALARSVNPSRLDGTAPLWAGGAALLQPAPVPSPSPEMVASLAEGAKRAVDDAEMTARSLALIQELGPTLLQKVAARAPAQPVAAGDTLQIWTGHDRTCSAGTQVTAVVRYVGSSTLWLDDVDNPAGTFSDTELADLNSFYEANAKPVHDAYYGGLSDVDGDGRVWILMTKEVNKTPSYLGWVWSGDLFPTTLCATSNDAELFVGEVPDPSGVYGTVRTTQGVLDRYPDLLTHEITHLVQDNAMVFGGAAAKKTWELEGGARLAEQLVAFSLYGETSGQDLGYTAYYEGQSWYAPGFLDLANYYGWDGTIAGHVSGAPEQCTWIGRVDEGNTGPCIGSQVYGPSMMVLRYMLDRWGPDYPGGEQALMQHLTTSSSAGFASLEEASGWQREQILAEFYALLWADGRVLNMYGMTSWNLYDIFSHFVPGAQLQPYVSSAEAPQLTATVRGGSNAYLHWTPSGPVAPVAIKVTTSTGAAVPATISLWALRVQ